MSWSWLLRFVRVVAWPTQRGVRLGLFFFSIFIRRSSAAISVPSSITLSPDGRKHFIAIIPEWETLIGFGNLTRDAFQKPKMGKSKCSGSFLPFLAFFSCPCRVSIRRLSATGEGIMNAGWRGVERRVHWRRRLVRRLCRVCVFNCKCTSSSLLRARSNSAEKI